MRAARAVGEERVQVGAQGAARAPAPPDLVDAAELEGPWRPLADSSADRNASLCRCPLLACWLQRGQPKVGAAAVALAEAAFVALSQIAHEAWGDLLPLPAAVVPIGAARGSAGALPERHWAGAAPSAPPFGGCRGVTLHLHACLGDPVQTVTPDDLYTATPPNVLAVL